MVLEFGYYAFGLRPHGNTPVLNFSILRGINLYARLATPPGGCPSPDRAAERVFSTATPKEGTEAAGQNGTIGKGVCTLDKQEHSSGGIVLRHEHSRVDATSASKILKTQIVR